MIIVRIIGGLGNQLFQYAAAKALAQRHKTHVKLDTSSFNEEQLRNFDLLHLNIDATLASAGEIKKLKAFTIPQRIRSYLTPYPKRKFYKQPFFHFDKKFFKLGHDVYMQGYFQSEKFFRNIEKDIREDFRIKDEKIKKVTEFGQQLNQLNSVALHIRRGDYSNKETLRVHGILPMSYYKAAIELLQSKYSNLSFFIFTDDRKWVEDNLQLPDATTVSGNVSSTHFEDIYLMSLCHHNIIANSSFSWWGAWLNENKNKTVIAPAQWFNDGPKDTQDLLPASWIKI